MAKLLVHLLIELPPEAFSRLLESARTERRTPEAQAAYELGSATPSLGRRPGSRWSDNTLALLAGRGGLTVAELAEAHGRSQQAVRHTLRTLRSLVREVPGRPASRYEVSDVYRLSQSPPEETPREEVLRRVKLHLYEWPPRLWTSGGKVTRAQAREAFFVELEKLTDEEAPWVLREIEKMDPPLRSAQEPWWEPFSWLEALRKDAQSYLNGGS